MIVVVLLFSGNIVVGKAAADALPPMTLAWARCVIALALAMLIFGREAWRVRALFHARRGRLFLVGAAGIGLFNALLYLALHTASATAVAVLEAAIPIFTAVVARCWLGERLGWLGWVGVVLSALGAVCVITRGAPGVLFAQLSPGIGVMLLAIAAWIIYSLTALDALTGLPPLAVMVPLTGAATIALTPLAAIEQWMLGGAGALTWQATGAALYLGIGPSFIAFIFYNWALQSVGPTAAALALNALPIVVMIFDVLCWGAPLSSATLLGVLATVVGVSAVIMARRTQPIGANAPAGNR